MVAIRVNITEADELLLELMKINSTTGQEGELSDALKVWLEEHGWVVQQQGLDQEPHRKNLLAMRPGVSVKQIRLVLNSHLDTVPPYIPPSYSPEDGVIKGRGACDAKAMLACMSLVANKLVQQHAHIANQLALLFVVGEEAGHHGMIKANEFGLQPEYMIVGEPTELTFARRQKGIINIQLNSVGKAVHSGYPHLGSSAIEPMVEVLRDLMHADWPKDKELGATTVNIGTITGGQAVNATAAECHAKLLFRIISDPADMHAQIEKVVSNRVQIEYGVANPPVDLYSPPSVPIEQTTIVAFNTDVAYFKSATTKSLLYGPGSITDAHSAWEYVRVADLRAACVVYEKTIIELLAG